MSSQGVDQFVAFEGVLFDSEFQGHSPLVAGQAVEEPATAFTGAGDFNDAAVVPVAVFECFWFGLTVE